ISTAIHHSTFSFYSTAYATFFFDDAPTTEIYTLSLHDALPISRWPIFLSILPSDRPGEPFSTTNADMALPPLALGSVRAMTVKRSEEHTSELQSRENLVCRLLLEKKKLTTKSNRISDASNTSFL